MPDVQLKPGDVFLTRGVTWYSSFIRRLTTSPGEPISEVNHAGAMLSMGTIGTAIAIESSLRVRTHTLTYEYGGTGQKVAIARPRISDDERLRLAADMSVWSGTSYGWGELPTHFVDHLLSLLHGHDVVWARHAVSQRHDVICSGLVANAFNKVLKWRFCGVDPEVCQPDDIWDDWFDVKRGHPERWELLLPLQKIPKGV